MEEEILNLFAYDSNLTFTEIKNKLKIRSNLLSYWLNQLLKKQIIQRNNNSYSLTESSEYLIPYLSKNKSILPVILIQIGNSSCFLHKRIKRPYKGLLSLPGGRILLGESLKSASERIMKNKFNIEIKETKLKSISLEHIKKKNKIIHTFILILVTSKSKSPIYLTDINKNKRLIIPSDYHLIISKSNISNLPTIFSKI